MAKDEVFKARVYLLDWIELWLESLKDKISNKSYEILRKDLRKYWIKVDPNPPMPHDKFEKMFS